MDTNDKNLNTAMTLLEGILGKANFTKDEGKKYYIYFPVFDEENGKIIAEFPIFESTEDGGAKLIGWQKYNLDDYRLAEYVVDNQNISISDAELVNYKKDEDENLLRSYIAVFLKIKEFKKAGQGIDVSAESKAVVEDLVNDFENAIVDVISEEVNSFYNYEIEYEDEEEAVENTDILNDIDGLDDLDDFSMPGTEDVEEVEDEIEEEEELDEVEDDLDLSSLDDDSDDEFEEVDIDEEDETEVESDEEDELMDLSSLGDDFEDDETEYEYEEVEEIEEESEEVDEIEDDLDLSGLGDLDNLDDLDGFEDTEEVEETEKLDEVEDDLDLSSLDDSSDDELMDLSSLGDFDDDDAFEAVVEKAEEELEDDLDLSSLGDLDDFGDLNDLEDFEETEDIEETEEIDEVEDDLDLSSLDDEFEVDSLDSLETEKEETDLSDLGSSLDDLDDFTMPDVEELDDELELDEDEVEDDLDLSSLDLDEFEDIDDDEVDSDFEEVEELEETDEEDLDLSNLDLDVFVENDSDVEGNEEPESFGEDNELVLETEEISNEELHDDFDGIIGLETVKEKIEEFAKYLTFVSKSKENGIAIDNPNLNMLFVGNPGTGKTIVAEIVTNKLYELGLIAENKLIDASNYMMVEEAIEEATDGVLFITEEYMMNNFCLEVLSDVMEDKHTDIVVIFAGCKKCMRRFLTPRISTKIGCIIEFPDYSDEVLSEILIQKIGKAGLTLEDDAKDEIRKLMNYFSDVEKIGNAKFVSKVFEDIVVKHSNNADADIRVITTEDIPTEKEMIRSILSKKYVLKLDKSSEESLRRAAIHEVGHAAIKRLLTQKSLVKAIIVNPDYFGSIKFIDVEKHEIFSKEDYLTELKCILAGMAAEEVLLGSFGNINHRDLEQATHIARKMVARLGMSNLGLAQIDDLECEMTAVIYEEVNKLLKECYDEVVALTNKNKAGIERVVEYLLKNEEIDEKTFIKEFENKVEKPVKVAKEIKKEEKPKAATKTKTTKTTKATKEPKKETKAKKETKTKAKTTKKTTKK